MFLTKVEHASNDLLQSDSSFLLRNNFKTNTTSIEIQLYACNLHREFALFCTPYYLRHSIEIFNDYSLLLGVTALVAKLKKIMQSTYHQINFLSFRFYIQTGSAQQQRNVCNHKMDKSSFILFGLTCSEKIKYIQQI